MRICAVKRYSSAFRLTTRAIPRRPTHCWASTNSGEPHVEPCDAINSLLCDAIYSFLRDVIYSDRFFFCLLTNFAESGHFLPVIPPHPLGMNPVLQLVACAA
eukprot:GEMP01099817.1.p1 GENE.GEMP01099817.1~~GEMP01099817.1.p1  ORF type:complete len:102 (+),score=3.15 GEMP01099817.1:384-689(+)